MKLKVYKVGDLLRADPLRATDVDVGSPFEVNFGASKMSLKDSIEDSGVQWSEILLSPILICSLLCKLHSISIS